MTVYNLQTTNGKDVAVDIVIQGSQIVLTIGQNTLTWQAEDAGKAFLATPEEAIWPGGEGAGTPILANAVGRAVFTELKRPVDLGSTETVSQFVGRGNTAGVIPVQIRAYRFTDDDVYHVHFFHEDNTERRHHSLYRELPQVLVDQIIAADRLFALDFTDKVRAAISGKALGAFLTHLAALQPGEQKS